MYRVLVLGSTGMLGSQLCRSLKEAKVFYDDTNSLTFDALKVLENPDIAIRKILDFDFVINCIGQIKPRFKDKDSILKGYKINSIFPRLIADICEETNSGFIHITTDCVYSGSKGKYTEDVAHDAVDDYGVSKSLGEPNNCTVIRTSIIGEEPYNKYSLVEWAKSQANQDVSGFTNHFWNGLTTKELSRVMMDIMKNGKNWKGTRHKHASSDVDKFTLLGLISDRFSLNLKIDDVDSVSYCDRTLRSNYSLCSSFNVPTVEQMIKEM